MLWQEDGGNTDRALPLPKAAAGRRGVGNASQRTKLIALSRLRRAFVILSVLLSMAPAARADERNFGYIFSTDTLPHGKLEQQDWLTAGLEKSRGDYELYQLATGVDYGVTDDLQAALYLNSHLVNADRDSIAGRTSGLFVPRDIAPTSSYSSARVDGVSLALKYRVLSPYKDLFGLAFSIEPTLGRADTAIEYRLIGHKNFDDDTVIWATNLVLLQDWQHVTSSPVNIYAPTQPGGPAGWNRSSFLEFDTGLSVRFTENWFAGVEFRNSNEFGGPFLQQAGSSAFFLGPDLHYGGESIWVTLSVLPQLPLARAYTSDQRQVLADGRIYGDEYERLAVRLGLGLQF